MSQQDKSRYFKALKDAGVQFSKHYREYTEADLKVAFDELVRAQEEQAHAGPSPEPPDLPVDQPEDLPSLDQILDMHRPDPEPDQQPVPKEDGPDFPADPPFDPAKLRQAAADFTSPSGVGETTLGGRPQMAVPVKEKDPDEMAGVRLNTKHPDEPIRTDELGRIWYQEEVLKPAFPKPRGRRILRYKDRGTTTKTVVDENSGRNQFSETFEVPGDGPVREVEVKITLPSYQVGIYKDRRFPFKIHTYNGVQGFDLFEVQDYYGGSELVPAGVKRMYVENDLCYDVRTVIRAIQEEFRQYQLAGRIKL